MTTGKPSDSGAVQGVIPGAERNFAEWARNWMARNYADQTRRLDRDAVVNAARNEFPTKLWLDNQGRIYNTWFREQFLRAVRTLGWQFPDGQIGQDMIHLPSRSTNGRPAFDEAKRVWLAKLRLAGATLATVRREIEEYRDQWADEIDIDVDATFLELCREASLLDLAV
jgi:hypothetical protein